MRHDGLPFSTVSLTFRDAPTATRARLAEDLAADAWQGLRAQGAEGVVGVHTCQRSLWVLCGRDPGWIAGLLQAHLAGRVGGDVVPAVRLGVDAVRHLLEVAAGLDAFVQGEADVGAQVARAFAVARAEHHDDVPLRMCAQAVAEVRASGRLHGFVRPNRGVGQLAVDALLARGVTPAQLVGVVGAGAIGQRVVASLRRAAFRAPACFNRTPTSGWAALDDLADARLAATVVCTAGPERWFHPREAHGLVVDLGVPRQVAGAAVDLDALLDGPDLHLDPEHLELAHAAVDEALALLLGRLRARERRTGLQEARRLRDRFLAEELDGVLAPAMKDLSPAQEKRVREAAARLLRQYNHRVVAWLREAVVEDGA